jgi:hypothetical protein
MIKFLKPNAARLTLLYAGLQLSSPWEGSKIVDLDDPCLSTFQEL